MKILYSFLFALSLFGGVVAHAAEEKSAQSVASTAVKEISLEETETLLREQPDVLVLDVRMHEEVAELGYLPNARNVDFLQGDFVAQVNKIGYNRSLPVVIYCAIGGRAKQAAGQLAAVGYKDLRIPKGCFTAWKKAGKPISGGKKPE